MPRAGGVLSTRWRQYLSALVSLSMRLDDRAIFHPW